MYLYKSKKVKGIKDCLRQMGSQHLENVMEENQTKENPVSKWIKKNRNHLTNSFIPYDTELGLKDPRSLHAQTLAIGWLYGGVSLISNQALRELVFETEMPSKFPEEWLDFIPAWTVAIDVGKEDETFFLGYRKNGKRRFIIIATNTDYGLTEGVTTIATCSLELRSAGNGLVEIDYDDGVENEQERMLWLSLAKAATSMIFLCTLIPPNYRESFNDIKFREIKKNGSISYEVKPRERDVKVDITPGQVKYLKGFNTDLKAMQGIKHAKAAHIRRAHWRRYWVGPRNGERKRKLCWIPPTFVRGYVPHTQD